MKAKTPYIPAMHFRWLTPLYDPLLQWTLPDKELKNRMIRQAAIEPGSRMLDLGCGTATLALMVKKRYPDTTVIGLDIDPQILNIARRKMLKSGREIELHLATATRLPYPDCSFDRVLSSFTMHHLIHENKQRSVAEVFRVLRPGGELHVLDFGKPHNGYCFLLSLILRWTEELMDNINGLLPGMFRSAGFVNIEEYARKATLLGTVSLYVAHKPE